MPTPDSERRPGERIAKLLARAGIASRREIERMIAEGRVARDGVAIDTPATVLTSLHGVTVDGQPVEAPAAARLFVYHKPAGLLVTERDPRGRPTIYDRLPAGLPRVVPVGRLDLATEGLLLLTTDGGLKRQLELPATGVERTYRARAYGPVSQAQLEELIHGVEIDGIRYGAIDANLERRTGANVWIEMTLTEGKNREVRRVLEHLGLQVGRLIRTRYGPFVLGELAPGEVGEVRATDIATFRLQLDKRLKPDAAIDVARLMLLPRPTAPVREVASADRSPKVNRQPEPVTSKSPRSRSSTPSARTTSPAGKETAGGKRPALSRSSRGDDRPAAGPARREPGGKSEGEPKRPQRASKAAAIGSDRSTGEETSRAPHPKRKPGWARPKPRSGPKRPRAR